MQNIVNMKKNSMRIHLIENVVDKAKRMGFADKTIAKLLEYNEKEVYDWRKEHGIVPVYKMVDTCAGRV